MEKEVSLLLRNRIEEIKAKGFNIIQGSADTKYASPIDDFQNLKQIDYNPVNFNKIKIFPPSNAGIGKRFVTPNDNEINAK